MLTVLTCIATEHDLSLLTMAVLICIVANLTAFRASHIAQTTSARMRPRWQVFSALMAAGGVWSMHFIAMLAYAPGVELRFDPLATVASLMASVLGVGLAFSLTAARAKAAPAWISGALAALGIAIMHYLGVAAVETALPLEWRPSFVIVSVFIILAGAIGAFVLARRGAGWWAQIGPALLLSLATGGLHFTAMGGMTLSAEVNAPGSPGLNHLDLALVVGAAAVLVLIGGISILVIEAQARRMAMLYVKDGFRHVSIGLALFDADRRLLTWNEAYANLASSLGARPREGETLKSLIDQVAASGKMTAAIGREADWSNHILEITETPGWHERELSDGRWIRVQHTATEGGRLLGTMVDVTALKAAKIQLAQALDRAEAASRAKSEFLANMSHEIRTPLNGILGMAQVMSGDDLSPAQATRLGILRDSGRSLLSVVDAVLDISRVEAGSLSLKIADADVADMVEQCCGEFEAQAVDRDIALSCDIDASAAGLWKVDIQRLRQILANLLSNSLKFTLEGRVSVRLWATETSLNLSVEDTGIGMEPDQIPRMFEIFVQGDATLTRRFGGTGLGLTICHELVELMGGRIEVESQPGGGSVFTVAISPDRGRRLAPAAPARTVDAEDSGRIRVLAAEDNLTNQIVLRSLLAPLNVDLTMVENGALAVAAVETGDFDVILMDIQMPVMDGVTAARTIRDLELDRGLSPTPIFAVSANILPHQIDEYRASGIDGWIAKPIEVAKLYEVIRRAGAMSEHRALREAAA